MAILNLLVALTLFSQTECNDDLYCTKDINENGNCNHTLTEGFCLIENICYRTYDISSAGCGICLAQKNQYNWSNNENDELECTTDTKDENGNCLHILKKGFCLIEHRCIIDGTEDINGCKRCNASENPYDWTPYNKGRPCNDGINCTKDDTCDGNGNCAGKEYICNDRIDCTLSICDGKGGCNFVLKNNFCYIENQCFPDLETNPVNECQNCNVLIDQYRWTSIAYGVSCDDKSPYTPFDYCDGKGKCVGYQTDPFADAGNPAETGFSDIHSYGDTGHNSNIERGGCSCSLIY